MKAEGGFRKNDFLSNSGRLQNPVVSIITIVYNNIEHIEKTIQSAVNQAYYDKEYIIIDGGSKDGTLDIIKNYEPQIDYWISEPDKGIYDAMNKGLHLAKGDYVVFLNSGDLFFNDEVLSKVFSTFDKDVDIFYGETNLMDENGVILGTRTNLTTRKLPSRLTWKDMKWGMVVSHQSIFVKRSIAPDYNLSYKFSADIDWVIESLKRSKKIVNVNTIVSNYLIGGYSIKNQKKSWKERFEIYQHHYGMLDTLWVHGVIILKNIGYKLGRKVNY
jgi:glycosyltransferase involved in cell wall biosynthesis